MRKKTGKSVSLVLGSGGARGLAHIGIVRELQNEGFDIQAISGASIGALVGGAFATGKLDEFEEWVRAINRMNMLNLMDVNWNSGGLLKGDKIRETVTKLFGDWKIEDLPVKFTAVAVDIVKEKEVWLASGSLSSAMRASISLPLFMTPIRRKGAILVDGGVLNPVPVGPTLNDESDMTIAVNLGGLPLPPAKTDAPKNPEKPTEPHIVERVREFFEGLAEAGGPKTGRHESMPDMFNVGDRTFDVMQNCIARQKIAANPPDHLIEIPRNACGIMDFDRASEMIELGRHKARGLIARISEG